MSEIIYSPYQKDLFKNIGKEQGHTIVQAYAGSGKTTSIIEGFRYVPKAKKILALAFNKIIQKELKERAPSYVEALTFHSIGLRAITQKFGKVEIDEYKCNNIVKNLLPKKSPYDLINNICDTIAHCKYSLLDSPSAIDEIIDNFGIDLCDLDRPEFIKIVIKALGQDKLETKKIDFNDMCWFPFVYDLNLGQYDYVFTDESQDLNKSQLVMAIKACKNDGRIIMVLDEYQSIYSWRGSDTSIISDIKANPTTKTLTLPISYRCPQLVINLAKNWVPDIKCPEDAIQGEIKEINFNEMYEKAKPGCFILSRTNAPLIKACMQFIRNGVKANIRGRDVGKNLANLIKKSKKKQVPAFLKWLDAWKDKEIEFLLSKNLKTDSVLDKHECLNNLCEDAKDTDEVIAKISKLFDDTDEKNIIILSTVHKAKGLERDDVFIIRHSFRIWLDKIYMLDKPNEEANIAYVAATRAKKRLFIVKKL